MDEKRTLKFVLYGDLGLSPVPGAYQTASRVDNEKGSYFSSLPPCV